MHALAAAGDSPSDLAAAASSSSSISAAAAVTLASPPPPLYAPWVRINQDSLGSRRACEFACEQALRAGSSVIIDRTNIDVSQRATWVGMGARFHLQHIECLRLDMPVAVCKQRVLDRVGHETLPATAASLAIVDRFLNDLVPPIREEGFSRMHTLTYNTDDKVQKQTISDVIQRCLGLV